MFGRFLFRSIGARRSLRLGVPLFASKPMGSVHEVKQQLAQKEAGVSRKTLAVAYSRRVGKLAEEQRLESAAAGDEEPAAYAELMETYRAMLSDVPGELLYLPAFNRVLATHVYQQRIDRALDVFDDLLREGLVPNSHTYSPLCMSLLEHEQADFCVDLFRRWMASEAFDFGSSRAFVGFALRKRSWPVLLAYDEFLRERGVPLRELGLATALLSYYGGEVREAFDIEKVRETYARMLDGIKNPPPTLLDTAMRAEFTAGNAERARALFTGHTFRDESEPARFLVTFAKLVGTRAKSAARQLVQRDNDARYVVFLMQLAQDYSAINGPFFVSCALQSLQQLERWPTGVRLFLIEWHRSPDVKIDGVLWRMFFNALGRTLVPLERSSTNFDRQHVPLSDDDRELARQLEQAELDAWRAERAPFAPSAQQLLDSAHAANSGSEADVRYRTLVAVLHNFLHGSELNLDEIGRDLAPAGALIKLEPPIKHNDAPVPRERLKNVHTWALFWFLNHVLCTLGFARAYRVTAYMLGALKRPFSAEVGFFFAYRLHNMGDNAKCSEYVDLSQKLLHVAAKMPIALYGSNGQKFVCPNCFRTGHLPVHCPSLHMRKYDKPRCWNCNSTTHFAKRCKEPLETTTERLRKPKKKKQETATTTKAADPK